LTIPPFNSSIVGGDALIVYKKRKSITAGGIERMWEVTVDKDKCTGDEECVEVCPVDVFEMVDGKADPVNAEECLGCESCVEVCEFEAITVEEV
jgi:NAD-dependent dihydropyrimidine dehydrogenase PreA subunit